RPGETQLVPERAPRLMSGAADSVGEAESVAAEDASVAELKEQIGELKAKLAVYNRLEEDLMAQRVFVKARRQLTTWITVGGLVAFGAGFIGFRQIEDYTRHAVSQKVQRVAERQVRVSMAAEERRQIAHAVRDDSAGIRRSVQQQLSALVLRSPLKFAAVTAQAGAVAAPAASNAPASVDYV